MNRVFAGFLVLSRRYFLVIFVVATYCCVVPYTVVRRYCVVFSVVD
jgi:hypothetical protein